MSLNNMYIEDSARDPKAKKGYFIQKKVVILGLILLALIFIGAILVTYFSTNKDSECSISNDGSSKNKSTVDQMCSDLFCSNPLKINGKLIFLILKNRT